MLMTTGEYSFVLRQGIMYVTAHPVKGAKAVATAYKAMTNETFAQQLHEEMEASPDYLRSQEEDGLYIANENAKLVKQEESLMGRWIGKWWGIRHIARAGIAFLNKLRMDTYHAGVRNLRNDKAGRKAIAKFANESSGRGGLGPLEGAAVPLARLFFSPRFNISRLQLLLGHSMWGGSAASRKFIAMEYARAAIGLAMMYQMQGMLLDWLDDDDDDEDKKKKFSFVPKIVKDVNWDMRSGEFAKMKAGNTRLDLLGGLGQIAVFLARTMTGESVDKYGNVRDIRTAEPDFGQDTWKDIALRFGRSKLHPVPSSVIDLLDGSDMMGNAVTIGSEGAGMLSPITWKDIYEAFQEHGLDETAAIALVAFFGQGVQVYKENTEKQAKMYAGAAVKLSRRPQKEDDEEQEHYNDRLDNWENFNKYSNEWLAEHEDDPLVRDAVRDVLKSDSALDIMSGLGWPKAGNIDTLNARQDLWIAKRKSLDGWYTKAAKWDY
jgi:hypothetical protein